MRKRPASPTSFEVSSIRHSQKILRHSPNQTPKHPAVSHPREVRPVSPAPSHRIESVSFPLRVKTLPSLAANPASTKPNEFNLDTMACSAIAYNVILNRSPEAPHE